MPRRDAAKNATRADPDSVGQQVERAQLAADGRAVQGLQARREPPQVGRQPGLDVGEVRGRVLQAVGEAEAVGELVRSPVDGELRVQRVGEQRRVAPAFGVGLGLGGEACRALGLPGVRPSPGQRRGQPGAGRALGPRAGLEQQGGHAAGNPAERGVGGQRERGGGHGLGVARGLRALPRPRRDPPRPDRRPRRCTSRRDLRSQAGIGGAGGRRDREARRRVREAAQGSGHGRISSTAAACSAMRAGSQSPVQYTASSTMPSGPTSARSDLPAVPGRARVVDPLLLELEHEAPLGRVDPVAGHAARPRVVVGAQRERRRPARALEPPRRQGEVAEDVGREQAGVGGAGLQEADDARRRARGDFGVRVVVGLAMVPPR